MDLIAPGDGILYWQLTTLAVGFGYFCFMIYALVDLIRSDFREQHMKLIWALMILFIPIIGTFLYLSMNRRTKNNFRKFTPDFSSHQTSKHIK
ncbi:PLD nuclease N-terminal domain-containing protein [Algoriphagus persicinus]|uniref:PLD nuclease N-terminal domain-containing protein n=1 Tax=Algoriphagus persicinus TaxID=3108754 RepID=UPI002B3869C0|nr:MULTISPECIES: PLD nuclease N-terminal domain-containing protein [unclassified Algoriphagus]MEB2778920.1 PLD nuclease N-terminal domain-containing protein [Algoriphagus sp. C2-6-M1]MEB2783435.1 PLD nuclease N-terminal domain-containing protein [Algoriphagus sp. E1-3-M2]